ncbi:plasmid partitioning protein RepB C-terminal domain-containing protein [Burkholderia sp. 22PA0106]|uniref:ParB/RepB/Spo0J family partition protein n=1 Tax=Burkholderia sp. 22PA0106 TaxID=3237371 RepID=UPI0039C30CF4
MSNVKHAFEKQVIEIPVDRILVESDLVRSAYSTKKFNTIVGSISELGMIEPLAVFRSRRNLGDYELLDGRLRLAALKQLGKTTAPCMISTDDEAYTFNRHITRLSAVQEHKMIRAALLKGASEKRIAEVLKMDIRSIRERAKLLDGVAPEAASILKNRHAAPKVFQVLKKMKPYRQIEAAEMMVAANKFTATYAEMILIATRPDALAEGAKPKKKDEISPEDLAKMENEMDRLRQDCQGVEEEMGETMLSLVVAKSFMARLLRNESIERYLNQHHRDLLTSLTSTIESIDADHRGGEQE